jgi:hypothetical protein
MDGVIMAQCLVCTTGVLWLSLNWGVVLYDVLHKPMPAAEKI